jgi:hypothetical protein
MTKHLVSTLKRTELQNLVDELEMRLLADYVLEKYAKSKGIDLESLPRDFVCVVTSGSLNGVGFAAEEVRGLPRVPTRGRGGVRSED